MGFHSWIILFSYWSGFDEPSRYFHQIQSQRLLQMPY